MAYQNGQIYKIWDNSFSKCYIGSTIQPLSKRTDNHRTDYKKYLNGKFCYLSVFELFEEFGVENCKIEWVEDYPCKTKKELEAREGQIQRENDCVNKRIAGRNPQSYYQETRETRLEKAKEYREQEGQSEKHSEYCKKRYEEKKEEINEKQRQYRKDNPEKVREQDRQAYQRNKALKQRPWTCDCGATMCFSAKSRHLKTNKHKQYLQKQNNTD